MEAKTKNKQDLAQKCEAVIKFTAEMKHFYSCIDFGRAFLDARAVTFMNEGVSKLIKSLFPEMEA